MEKISQDKRCHSNKFNSVTELDILLRKSGYGYKGHIKYDLGNQPPDAHREVAKYQAAHDRKRVVEHIRRVERRELEPVDHKLCKQKLNKKRHSRFFVNIKKAQPFGQRRYVLDTVIPKRREDQRQ